MRICLGRAVLLSCAALLLAGSPAGAQCVGDCGGDDQVTIDDLILGVNIALGTQPVSACPAFANGEGEVTIAQLIQGVNNALDGCPPPVATPTASATATNTPPTPLSTATSTATLAPPTATASASPSRTESPTRSPTHTASPSATPTASPSATASITPTPTATGPTATPTIAPPCFEDDDCPVGQVCVEGACMFETPTATPTSSATTTSTPLVSPTATSSGVATATDTATVPPTATATASASPTATSSGVATATDTATVPPTATATASASPTATAVASGTHTSSPTHTATALPSATASATPTVTHTASATPTASSTSTATRTATPTETPFPPGEAVGGRAAIVSTGLGGVQALVGAVAAIINNDGAALTALSFDPGGGPGGSPDVDNCTYTGTTSQECSKAPNTVLTIDLGAQQCVEAGPAGGRAEFDGGIELESSAVPIPETFNRCDPLRFISATFETTDLTVTLYDDQVQPQLSVAAELTGTAGPTAIDPNCVIGGLNLTLNGMVSSTVFNGPSVQVFFDGTSVAVSAITYNMDCVPLAYTLTFNGNASFSADTGIGEPAGGPAGGLGETSFGIVFTNFKLTQDATDNPVVVTMMGGLTSANCFGGLVSLQTFAPLAVFAGQLCPDSGQLNVTGENMSMATIVYDDGGVTVTPAGGAPQMYVSCLAPELLLCEPQ